MTTKQQIISLVSEIKDWNDGDIEFVNHPNGEPILDKECVKARAKAINKLQKLVNKL